MTIVQPVPTYWRHRAATRAVAERLVELLNKQPFRCDRCGRPLREPRSIARGVGPVCLQRRPCHRTPRCAGPCYLDVFGACR